MGLVAYTSDSDDDHDQAIGLDRQGGSSGPASASRKRALPVLPGSYATGTGPKDDPSLHQGRKRSRPYVDGDHDTHIYISLDIAPCLLKALKETVSTAQESLPNREIHLFPGPLHISLAHPFPLRRHQIDQVQSQLAKSLAERAARGTHGPFHISLAGDLRVYQNGKRYGGDGFGGRAFLALRVGAGANEIDSIVSDVIHPLLHDIHRPLYHSDPEYHASFAWWLEQDPSQTLDLDPASSREILSSQPKGGWLVDQIHLKIGKSMTGYMV